VIIRMQHHEPTNAYLDHRITKVKTKRDILRCLKRCVIREANQPFKVNPRTGEITRWRTYKQQHLDKNIFGGGCKMNLTIFEKATITDFNLEMADYIDRFHNLKRGNSPLAMVPPTKYEGTHAPIFHLTDAQPANEGQIIPAKPLKPKNPCCPGC
jgi:hypothetical protein